MSIDISRLDPVSYCIAVLWLNGAFSTSLIADVLNVTDGRVRGVCRVTSAGGRMPDVRDNLSKEQRQKLLTELKKTRLDEDRLEPWCFAAVELHAAAKTRRSQKEIQRAQMKLKREASIRREERSLGGAVRGVDSYPLEWLIREKKLLDADEVKSTELNRGNTQMRRSEAGQKLRSLLTTAQIGGFKEMNMEVSSGGGGLAIQEGFIAAQSTLRAIQGMMSEADYRQLHDVVFLDEFIWDRVPSEKAKEILFEDIRRGFDLIAVHLKTYSPGAFEKRWGYVPMIKEYKSLEQARDITRKAKELINAGARQ